MGPIMFRMKEINLIKQMEKKKAATNRTNSKKLRKLNFAFPTPELLNFVLRVLYFSKMNISFVLQNIS